MNRAPSSRPGQTRAHHPFPHELKYGLLPELRTADIVLIRHKRGASIARRLLRRLTRSYWDHSAMIIFTRSSERGYASNIIIESIQHTILTSIRGGAEIHRLEKYLGDPERYEIGIKRFSWMDIELRRRVRAFMLVNIDTPYYPLNPFRFAIGLLSEGLREWVLQRQRFSCSGFIQKAFYEAMDWGERGRIIFRNVGYTPIQLQDITSPADIATSDACEWIYNKR